MQSPYLTDALQAKSSKKLVKNLCALIKEFGTENFDAIAFTGISGAVMAPIIAHKFGKDLIAVRKDEQKGHSWCKVEGTEDVPQKYIIVDDMIATGATIKEVRDKVSKYLYNGHKLVGVFLYNDPFPVPYVMGSRNQKIPVFSAVANK